MHSSQNCLALQVHKAGIIALSSSESHQHARSHVYVATRCLQCLLTLLSAAARYAHELLHSSTGCNSTGRHPCSLTAGASPRCPLRICTCSLCAASCAVHARWPRCGGTRACCIGKAWRPLRRGAAACCFRCVCGIGVRCVIDLHNVPRERCVDVDAQFNSVIAQCMALVTKRLCLLTVHQ